jgi:hypothetical protein
MKQTSTLGRLRAAVCGAAACAALLAIGVTPALATSGTHNVSATLASGATVVSASGPGITGTQAAVVCATRPDAWAAPIAGSSWLGTRSDCLAGVPAGDYTYTTTFTLPSNLSGLRDLRLDGSLLVDDTVTVRLNGHTVATGSGLGWTQAHAFSTAERSWFVPGVNSLTFVVSNGAGASGLDFSVRVSATVDSGVAGVIGHDDDDDREDDEDRDNRAKDDCKDGGWKAKGFRNQGQCVSAHARRGHGD